MSGLISKPEPSGYAFLIGLRIRANLRQLYIDGISTFGFSIYLPLHLRFASKFPEVLFKYGTGDARDILIKRGLYKEISPIEAMFGQARAFAETAYGILTRDLRSTPSNGRGVAPFVVNSAFSIELYFRTLAKVEGASLKGHSLLGLYDALPESGKRAIEDVFPPVRKKWKVEENVTLRQMAEALDSCFVEWRYLYETGQTNEISIHHLIVLMEVLDEVCRKSVVAS